MKVNAATHKLTTAGEVDEKKVIVNEASIRRDLRLDDAEGTACLPNDAIFEGLARMRIITPVFETMMVQAPEELGEGEKKKRTHGLKRMYKVGLSARIVSSDEEGLGDQEDASKHERIAEIDVDEDLFLIDETAHDQGRLNEKEMFGVDDLDGDEVLMDVTTDKNVEQSTKDAEKEVSTADPVKTGCEVVTTVEDVEVTTIAATVKGSWVNIFVDMNTEIVEERSKKTQEKVTEGKMKIYMKIIPDDEIAIDVIPLATKPPIIVGWKIIKEGKISSYHLIRANGSSKRYASMIQMLQHIGREDLETLWKLIKAKYGNTRPEEGYERVSWGDLKVMFEPDIESEVWRKLQENKVTIWKLFSSCGVHFVRFQNLHISLTPATITKMLNRKLQADHWNEMCYQLLMLMLKQQKKK
nr:hypothetical protein [Tanacetum cinerariifolium]